MSLNTRFATIHLLVFVWTILVGCSDPAPDKSASKSSPPKTKTQHPKSKSVILAGKSKTDRPPIFNSNGKTKSIVTPPPIKKKLVKPQTVYRPNDDRPKHDDTKLKAAGIEKYESKHLRLYTDIDPKLARSMLPLIDQAYGAWVQYFGKLPPARDGAAFQVTGYLMKDKLRFERAGLIPGDLPKFVNGRHRGYEFWMNDPPPTWHYYRRHLLIHEATHCFMYAVRDKRFATWYMEGMAEYFGTHRIGSDGRVAFGVMPDDVKFFKSSGRIELIQADCKAGSPLSIKNVVELKASAYVKNQPYAWSWALCKFLDSHAEFGSTFRAMGRIHTASTFNETLRKLVNQNSPRIAAEWHLFATGLDYGYDIKRAAVDVKPGRALSDGASVETKIAANRGWQSSGVWVDKGESIEITATGRFEVAQEPKPWISEPQGVTFTWYKGRPLGELQAVLVPDSKKSLPVAINVLPRGPVGVRREFKAEIKGTIYLRINDHPGKLADNKGAVTVKIRRQPAMK